MTKRNPDMESPMVVSIVVDYKTFQDFKTLVGDQNASREIRAMIKDRVKLEKNEQAQSAAAIDPLNLYNTLSPTKETIVRVSRQSTLFETFASRDRRNEIVDFVHSVKDTATLNTLETNAKCLLKVSEVHRKKLVTVNNFLG